MTEALVKELKKLVGNGKVSDGLDVLRKAKFELAKMKSLPPNDSISASSKSERLIAREVYEAAVLLSVEGKDMSGLERHLLLLRPFNFEYRGELGDSAKRYELVALELLVLMVQSRLAEFHSLLEMVSMSERENEFISFVVSIEQYLMEGSYNKVLDARKHTPSKIYSWLLENLEETVRDEIASCLEVSYDVLSMSAAQKLMNFPSKSALESYISSKDNWLLEGSNITFKGEPVKDLAEQIPSHQLIKESLGYSHELERIV